MRTKKHNTKKLTEKETKEFYCELFGHKWKEIDRIDDPEHKGNRLIVYRCEKCGRKRTRKEPERYIMLPSIFGHGPFSGYRGPLGGMRH